MRRKNMPHILFCLLLICISACLGCYSRSGPSPPDVAPGTEVQHQNWQPTFTDIGGAEHRPLEDASTPAFAIIFILTDCPVANSYVQEFNRLNEWLKDQRIPILLVHADPKTTQDEARQHAAEYDISCPIVLDPEQFWAKKSGASRVPEVVVFSTTAEILYRGRIDNRYVAFGKRRTAATSHDFRDAIEAIVAEKPVPHPRTEAVGCFIQLKVNSEPVTSAGAP